MSSPWTVAFWPRAEFSRGIFKEDLLGAPPQYGLVIPATLGGHLGGGVPEGTASAPCSKVGPRASEVPTQGRGAIPAGHIRLPRTSQAPTLPLPGLPVHPLSCTQWVSCTQCISRQSSPSFYHQCPNIPKVSLKTTKHN